MLPEKAALHHDVLGCLLEAGARTDLVTSAGATPLHVPARNRPFTARTLLDSGAEKNHATNCGESPFFVACQRGHLDVVRCLLDYGNDKDQEGTIAQCLCHCIRKGTY